MSLDKKIYLPTSEEMIDYYGEQIASVESKLEAIEQQKVHAQRVVEMWRLKLHLLQKRENQISPSS